MGIYKLKGLAKQNADLVKIARALKRTPTATVAKAQMLGIPLSAKDA